jgi:hypothetical protein
MNQRADAGIDEISEAISNPAIIHFTGRKPNTKRYGGNIATLRKWWEYHALSPFADYTRDAALLEEIIEDRASMKNSICSFMEYWEYLLFDDMQEAVERLKHFSAKGIKITLYGAGATGAMFARVARAMGLPLDKICDLNKRGAAIDGQPIESPDVLRNLDGEAIAVIAIVEPRTLTEAKNALLALGFPENRILPVFEQPAPGGGATSWIP